MQFSISEFEEIYHQCYQAAFKLAFSMLHEEDEARDVVNEVFLRLWESKSPIENSKAFLIRSVRNTCINQINRRSIREKVEQKLMLNSPSEELDFEQRNEDIRLAVRCLLTEREQQVIEKIYSEGLSYKETAENLNVSTSTVNKNIVSALKKLRTYFKTSRS